VFIVHLLPSSPEFAKLAEAFSKSDLAPHPSQQIQDPFELGQWRRNDNWGLSTLNGVLGALMCRVDKTINVGDHRLWIAEVKDIVADNDTSAALAYCQRKYRKEGESVWPHDPSDEDSGQDS
jgi:flavin reductase (DIM6/NTAB) family NADH-FMN oxidoreductase RutF